MIEPLVQLRSRAVALLEPNIDTDVIFPARHLLKIDREGLAQCAFEDRRWRSDGSVIPGFALNEPGFEDARILITGPGFGCGSSREQAVWALVDYGIRVIIGTDFGDIFAGNAPQNGMLLIKTDPQLVAVLAAHAKRGRLFDVNLLKRSVCVSGKALLHFDLSDQALQAFEHGWEELDIILQTEIEHVTAFEATHALRQPWLFRS